MRENREQRTENRERRGTILILAFVMMAVLLAIVGSFMAMTVTLARTGGYELVSSQALWVAEAGIEQVLYKLKNDADYRNNPTTISGNLGDGSFSVDVAKGGSTYTLTATGTVAPIRRKITQTIEVNTSGYTWDFADYIFYFGTTAGNYSLAKNSQISGNIFIKGNLSIGNNSQITGNVLATGSISLGKWVVVTGEVLPNSEPPATMPSLNTTHYDNEIAVAAQRPAGNQNISGTISGTTYVNGNVTINADTQTLTSATIVANGTITIKKDVELGDNIALIAADDLAAKQGYLIGKNCTLYSSTQVTIGKSGTFGSSSTGSVIITPGDVDIDQTNEIYGLVFAVDEISIGQNSEVTGNVAGGRINSIAQGTLYTLNNDLVDFDSIEGFIGAADQVAVNPQKDWNEIVPAI
jgi:predicted acyltransferase (DUF342 family)